MGTIAFQLPRIADRPSLGNARYAQLGPTCWYYAAKVLAKLHGFSDRLKQLHWVRRAISEISDLERYLGEDATEDIAQVIQRVGFEIARYKQWIDYYEGIRDNPVSRLSRFHDNKVREAATLAFRFRLGQPDYATARRKYAAMVLAKAKLEQVNSVARYDLLNGFVPGVFVRSEVDAGTLPAANVEKILRKWGPFYASGNLWASSRDTVPLDHLASGVFGNDSRAAVTVDHFEEGAHAIVVTGINVQTNVLYYKDPNNTAQVREISYPVFHTGWTRGGQCVLITVTCPTHHVSQEAKGGCLHTAQTIGLDSEEVVIGSLFD
ncbi:MAG: papain-like cysteine protease family protein [Acidobacteriota bacterium]